MTAQTWNSELYEKNARFVSDLGAPVLERLAARAGEDILDLGCGDGVLTKKIADLGCRVVGLDASADFVAAALHWMRDADAVIRNVVRALRLKGRFVAELGGHGCVNTVLSALIEELGRRGYDGAAANPWYFPTAEDYGARLAAAGFEVSYIALIPRPTPLPGDVLGWLATFSGAFTGVLPAAERQDYLQCVRARLAPRLCDANGGWTVDYVRLRFEARLRS